MIGTFKANNPVNAFLLFIYGLLLKFFFLKHLVVPIATKADGILYRELLVALQSIFGQLSFIYSLLAYLLLFTQAISFNKILNNQRLIQRPTYLPAMTYLLITSVFPEWNILSSALIANTLLIWVWVKVNGLHNIANPKTTLLNIGIAIGLASFFYFPSLAFLLLVVFALISSRPFNLAEWVITVIGIITPYYYLLVWMYLSDNFTSYQFPALDFTYPRLQSFWLSGAIVLILTAFFTGAYFVQLNIRNQVVQIRKNWRIALLYLLISVPVSFLNDAYSFKYWIIIAVPLAAFITCAFLYPSKVWFPKLLHWLIVAFIIVIGYYYK